jgi:cell division septum initiation protein DivIVA
MANAKIMMADTINRFARDYESMVKAAEFLKEIGTNEQIADELKAAAEAARTEAEAAKAELVKAKAAVKAQEAKSAEMLTKAGMDAADVLAAANTKADQIIDIAQANAGDIFAQARQDAQKATAGVAAQVAKLTTERDALLAESLAIEAAIELKQADATAIETRLAKAQAQIAKLLG